MSKNKSGITLVQSIIFLLSYLSLQYNSFAQSEDFTITITRLTVNNNLIYGTISLNSEEIGTAFENNSLKIPSGIYKGLMRYHSEHNFVQSELGKMSNIGDFLIEISNVNERTDILFHPGNKPKHSKGCILLGPISGNPSDGYFVDENHPLRKLRIAFYGTDTPTSCPNKNITIEIVDETE
jgi:hypothetical protein